MSIATTPAPPVDVTLQSGIDALVAVLEDQLRTDHRRGLRTAAFASGYPGSPLGGLDTAIDRRAEQLGALGLVHRRGSNEELAMTAVMGSQMSATYAEALHEGVLGVWYGKAPGLERAADAFRHAVFAGVGPAGAVALVGDDPANKSSTLPSASEGMLAELQVPVFAPGTVQEVRELGAHAIACSREVGLWTALKITTKVADGHGAVHPAAEQVASPLGAGTVSRSLGSPTPVDREPELVERLQDAAAYGARHRLNDVVAAGSGATIAVVVSGTIQVEVSEALAQLGIDESDLGALPIRLVRISQLFPLDRHQIRELCAGVDEVLVVEEKRPFLERSIRDLLYGGSHRPPVHGKYDADGNVLIPGSGALDATRLVPALRRTLEPPPPAGRLRVPAGRTLPPIPLSEAPRTPFFCSGCPHSTSLQAPEGAQVGVGIGCHGMVFNLPPERTGELVGFTQMGGEGAQWVGTEPFVSGTHLFQNLGDGTLAHSGILAIRFAIASGVNLTYKILYNRAVAMTGGQDAVGALTVPDLCRELLAEGVQRIVVTTEDLHRYDAVRLPGGVEVRDRDEIVAVQEALAATPGVTVLIHDQACAAELRRGRKRGLVPRPKVRVVIDERVCEGCGDCGVKSACLSLVPVETDFGTKTAIDQTSCNIDLSCLRGDCPSFLTVEVPAEGVPAPTPAGTRAPEVPDPDRPPLTGVWSARLPGIGGTGVVTLAQVLARGAALDGLVVASEDQTGLSQKAGPVVSEVHVHRPGADAAADGIDLLLVLDALTAATDRALEGCGPDRTQVVGTSNVAPTGATVADGSLARADLGRLQARIRSATGGPGWWYDAATACSRLFGSSVAANSFMLGAAVQAGLVPVSVASLTQAFREGPAAEQNLQAFAWGRAAVADPAALEQAIQVTGRRAPRLPRGLAARIERLAVDPALQALIRERTGDLVAFQHARLAAEYLDLVEAVHRAESGVEAGSQDLTEVVARQLHRVTAYKDEYEVARLLLRPESAAATRAVGGPRAKVTWNLHPPVLRAMGRHRKIGFGPRTRPALAVLRRAKVLRGSRLDPFGYSAVRREERRLVHEYRQLCGALADALPRIGVARATEIAGLVEVVRGYEGVKERNLATYRRALADALAAHDPAILPSPTHGK